MNKIELNFRSGKYQSTFQLGNDFRKMWGLAYKLFTDDSDKYAKTNSIQTYFDQVFAELENKPLQSVGPSATATPAASLYETPPMNQQPPRK